MILSATGSKTFDLLQAFMPFDQSCFCLLNVFPQLLIQDLHHPLLPVFWCKVRVECCSCTRRSHKSAGLSFFMFLLSSSMDVVNKSLVIWEVSTEFAITLELDHHNDSVIIPLQTWKCFFFQTCDMIKVLQLKSLVSSLNLEAAALPKTDDDLQIVNCWSAVHRLVWWSC